MKKTIFTGAGTALITPLNEKGVDYEAFGKLINWQIEKGIDALIICGTTGEGSTLSDEEHKEVLRFALETAAGRVTMVAGTGSNDTAYAIKLGQHACELGYDALLVITPYYNKATQNGLVQHFTAIADAVTKPMIIYNVPSRTGVNVEPSTYLKLADHENIVAIKEANGNLSKIVETLALVGDKLDIYSGNDDQNVPIIAIGGKGAISVLSNPLPAETSRMCHLALEGKVKEAMALQKKYLPLANNLFCEVNPIPVKAVMAELGFCENYLRLPMTPLEECHREKLMNCLKDALK